MEHHEKLGCEVGRKIMELSPRRAAGLEHHVFLHASYSYHLAPVKPILVVISLLSLLSPIDGM